MAGTKRLAAVFSEGIEWLLTQTIEAAQRGGALKRVATVSPREYRKLHVLH